MTAPLSAAPPHRSTRADGAALRKLLWDPLAASLDGATRIFVVPDGALSLVPFAALPSGVHSYVLETAPVIHYLSTERDVVSTPDEPTAKGSGLLALGGAAFDDPGLFQQKPVSNPPLSSGLRGTERTPGLVCGGLQTVQFGPLAGSLQEVRELSKLWRSFEDGENVTLLVGHDASEAAFKQRAHQYRVLHLATHGFFLNGTCATPAPVGTRAVGGIVNGPSGAITPLVANPLQMAGLAFAGANHRAAARLDEDDGILTAEEVSSLDLDGTEWAVLSACDTGLGEIKAGESVFGLRRAFQIAGVRTVIMSLWPVDDQATVQWMRELYIARLQKHMDTAESVQAASLAMLNARRAKGLSTHPFFWAGFVAAGDWH